jgi:ribonuclease HI
VRGEKYWKCSVVENEKNIVNFLNSRAVWSIEAEAYTILKTVYWLVEGGFQGKVRIWSDSQFAVNYYQKIKNFTQEKIQEKIKAVKLSQKYKTRAKEFVLLTAKVATSNQLDLEVSWIVGEKNPADYYSRNET